MMMMASPMLELWLGQGFGEGAPALSVLVSYWLLYGAILVTPGFLIGAGKTKAVAKYFAIIAAVNLLLSLVLTPALGLLGPALGTAIPFFLAFPYVLRTGLSIVDVTVRTLVRQVWLPAYSLGVALAVFLAAVRVAVGLEQTATLMCSAAAGVATYWGAFYSLCLARAERTELRNVLGGALGTRSRALK